MSNIDVRPGGSIQNASLEDGLIHDCNLTGVRVDDVCLNGGQIKRSNLRGFKITADCAVDDTTTICGVSVLAMAKAYDREQGTKIAAQMIEEEKRTRAADAARNSK